MQKLHHIVKCNELVKRQTKESQFSHFEGSWEELEEMVSHQFSEGRTGYKLGVMMIPVNPEKFRSGTIFITESTPLQASFEARRIGEEPFINVLAKGPKSVAKRVDVVVYSKEVLDENNEATTNAEWEIVNICAYYNGTEDPMHPITMMRNFLGLHGGTKGVFTAQQFAESIRFWGQHAMSIPE